MENIKTLHIQFIGHGNMWKILEEIIQEKSKELQISLDIGIQTKTRNENQLGKKADIICLCVKPELFTTISLDRYNSSAVCLSIMNGITTKKLSYFENIIRTMPNILAGVGEGITGRHEKWVIKQERKDFIKYVFTQSGTIIALDDEKDFSAFTAFAGCWPAIIAYIEQYCTDNSYREYVYDCLQSVWERLWFVSQQSSNIIKKLRTWLPKHLEKSSSTYAKSIEAVSAGNPNSSTHHIISSFNSNNLDKLLWGQNRDIEEILYQSILLGERQSDTLTAMYSA